MPTSQSHSADPLREDYLNHFDTRFLLCLIPARPIDQGHADVGVLVGSVCTNAASGRWCLCKRIVDRHPTLMPEKTAPTTVAANIRSVSEMESLLEQKRTVVDRIADVIGGFSGSMTFVFLHIAWLTTWFLINTRVIPHIKAFDPFPFILLAMIVSVEGVLLSTFVLMKQNRMQKRIDVRDQLDLQINLLSEKEVTKTLQLLRAIADKLEIVPSPEDDAELAELASVTSVDMVAQRVQSDLSPK